MMHTPAVTILLLSCDRPDLCAIALASAVEQTTRTQVIVCDDSTSKDVEGLAGRYGDQVRYLRGPRHGQLSNLLHAIPFVSTPWTLILHDDDILETVCVERLLAILPSPNVVGSIAIGDLRYVDADGVPLAGSNTSARNRAGIFSHGRNEMSLVLDWKPDPRVGSVLDFALCETIVKEVDTIWYANEELIRYRIHGESVGSAFADLDPLLFVLDGQLADPTFKSAWLALRHKRADAIVRQARVFTGIGRWRSGRTLLRQHRTELPWRYLLPTAMVTVPFARIVYGMYIRRRNPRLAAIHAGTSFTMRDKAE
jgi:hypothetical protein